ncbi:hypothetical protein PRZ48_006162 [Zasmidium cellare]|uniref:FAD-binding domain-containing protein n=1 Tax=Zasmidium cellare TaxID=395010 RepID=A0ABR0EN97_ZASCE|nr:hypothetical protein PRZ48_006162 [Zasmidium cellare]
MATANRRILIIGAGVAGSVAAYWLGQAGFEVTVIERASQLPTAGQGIDITGPALEIVRKMGVEEQIRSRVTEEGGFAIVDDHSNEIAALGNASEGKGTLTQEIEIMRGDLTRILGDAAVSQGNVTRRFGCKITELRQSEKSVTVVFSDSGKAEDFDVVIGADGLRSKTRELALGSEIASRAFCGRDQYAAFFSIPFDSSDRPNSRFQHAPGGRSILVRPVDHERSSCYLMVTAEAQHLQDSLSQSQDKQKEAWLEIISDFHGSIGDRARQGLKSAKDFYFERTAQIKMDKWSTGRVALVGDAAYAPSPLTGQGTTCGILGAYILAGEVSTNPGDLSVVFSMYDQRLREYVSKSQTIPLGGYAPNLLNPYTSWGIYVLRTIFWFIARTGLWKILDISPQGKTFELPEYSFGKP